VYVVDLEASRHSNKEVMELTCLRQELAVKTRSADDQLPCGNRRTGHKNEISILLRASERSIEDHSEVCWNEQAASDSEHCQM
jgi:hypothetical protein